jgi:hypothetical protein
VAIGTSDTRFRGSDWHAIAVGRSAAVGAEDTGVAHRRWKTVYPMGRRRCGSGREGYTQSRLGDGANRPRANCLSSSPRIQADRLRRPVVRSTKASVAGCCAPVGTCCRTASVCDPHNRQRRGWRQNYIAVGGWRAARNPSRCRGALDRGSRWRPAIAGCPGPPRPWHKRLRRQAADGAHRLRKVEAVRIASKTGEPKNDKYH